MSIYITVFKCICMHEYMYVRMHVCIVCVYTCVHASMCICMYVYIYIYIYIYIYVILKLGFGVRGGIVQGGNVRAPLGPPLMTEIFYWYPSPPSGWSQELMIMAMDGSIHELKSLLF